MKQGESIGSLTGIPTSGDIDIYLQGSCPEQGRKSLEQVFYAVQRNQARYSKKKMLVSRSRNAVTFYRLANMKLARPPVQVTSPLMDNDFAPHLAMEPHMDLPHIACLSIT